MVAVVAVNAGTEQAVTGTQRGPVCFWPSLSPLHAMTVFMANIGVLHDSC